MKFVIDMMGGDNGSVATSKAVKSFSSLHKDDQIYCVGKKNELTSLQGIDNISIVEANDVLAMDVDPLLALSNKESSMYVAVKCLIDNSCDAIVSAGSTGALLTLGTLKIKRLKGITRPALITPFPTIKKNKKFVVLDLGASTLNTKEEIVQFAKMGSIYYSAIFNESNPKVALLNIGTEEEKGNQLDKDAFQALKAEKGINFFGNIEARYPLYGDIDVLVTDGYSGNIFLKTVEGTSKAMSLMIKDAFNKNIFTKIGYLFSKDGIKEMKERMDYKNVGGAMLIGINSILIKAHGSSDEKSFSSALNMAYNLASKKIIDQIKKSL